ncbi:NirD/YgiW/YdeI family stress tolerance protein [Thorsellia kenyensis]|uniref:NirD/YgiW/YdeI family stress tolerance protein n=1 Tax=Thorsellia kenyensis TaxID=1549888 RepID=A0ABV6CEX5_9GAMM
MNSIKSKSVILFITLFFSTVSLAGFVGKNASNSVNNQTVKSLLDNPVDDTRVLLEGYITEKVRNEKYLFSDGTGTIRVEIDDKDFPSQPVDEKTKVKIYGDLEKDFLESPEIDVDFMEIIK